MDKKSLRILFMGTPDFAVESLKSLVENGYNVVGVVTMPDKPAGRGYYHRSLRRSRLADHERSKRHSGGGLYDYRGGKRGCG